MDHQVEAAKTVVDGISLLAVIGALSSVLPPIASLFTIIWMAIRIYESPTVQELLGRAPTKAKQNCEETGDA